MRASSSARACAWAPCHGSTVVAATPLAQDPEAGRTPPPHWPDEHPQAAAHLLGHRRRPDHGRGVGEGAQHLRLARRAPSLDSVDAPAEALIGLCRTVSRPPQEPGRRQRRAGRRPPATTHGAPSAVGGAVPRYSSVTVPLTSAYVGPPSAPRAAAIGLGQGEQLGRVLGPGLRVLQARQHADQLPHPLGARRRRATLAAVTCPALSLVTTTCWSAKAATCGRWVTTMTWAVRASRASRRPTSTATLPPMPASTSSKTKVGHAVDAGEHDLDRQHDARQLAAGRALAERAGTRCRRAASAASSTASAPSAVNAAGSSVAVDRRRASSASAIARSCSSPVTAAPNRSAAARRAAVSARRAAADDAPAQVLHAARRAAAIRSSAPSTASTRSPAAAAHQSRTSSSSGPYRRLSALIACRRSSTSASRCGSASTSRSVLRPAPRPPRRRDSAMRVDVPDSRRPRWGRGPRHAPSAGAPARAGRRRSARPGVVAARPAASCATPTSAMRSVACARTRRLRLQRLVLPRHRARRRRSRRCRAAAGPPRARAPAGARRGRAAHARPRATRRSRAAYAARRASTSRPANRSSSSRWRRGSRSSSWSAWPCTAISCSPISASVAAGTLRPPANARLRPPAATVRPSRSDERRRLGLARPAGLLEPVEHAGAQPSPARQAAATRRRHRRDAAPERTRPGVRLLAP